MAERKAVNKYYPPEWDPSKGSINKFRGQHPLRERARKLDQGILIVRFEMPFNIWCEGCKSHIGKGVRYNAEKKQIGNYFSTKIWSFRMKCHLCDNYIEVQTDPKNRDYNVTSGGRRKEETWDTKDSETISLSTEEEKVLAEDPFYKLEHGKQDEKKAEETAPLLLRLETQMKDRQNDYALSQKLRKNFREEKKKIAKETEENKKKGIFIPLLPPSQEDEQEAKQVFSSQIASFGLPVSINANQNTKKRKLEIKTASIFGKHSQVATKRAEILKKLHRQGLSLNQLQAQK